MPLDTSTPELTSTAQGRTREMPSIALAASSPPDKTRRELAFRSGCDQGNAVQSKDWPPPPYPSTWASSRMAWAAAKSCAYFRRSKAVPAGPVGIRAARMNGRPDARQSAGVSSPWNCSKALGTASTPCAMNSGLALTNSKTGVMKVGRRAASSAARSGVTKRGLWGYSTKPIASAPA